MFNLQPGTGLGLSASKQIAFGLGAGFVIDEVVITVPGPGGGDSRKGGLSYKPYYKPIDLPAEDFENAELREQIIREDQELLEFIQVIMAMGIIK